MTLATTFLIVFFISTRSTLRERPFFLRMTAIALVLLACLIATGRHVSRIYGDGGNISMAYVREMQEAHIIPYLSPHYQLKWNHVQPYNMYMARGRADLIHLAAFEKGEGDVKLTRWNIGDLRMQVDVRSKEATLVLKQSYVPIWKARDAGGSEIAVEPYGDFGLVALALPKGEHEIAVTLEDSAPERMAKAACALAVFICAAFLWKGRRHAQRR
jgi:hypothetical protein